MRETAKFVAGECIPSEVSWLIVHGLSSTSGPELLAGLPREPSKQEPGRKVALELIRLARQLDMIKTPLKFSQVIHQTR